MNARNLVVRVTALAMLFLFGSREADAQQMYFTDFNTGQIKRANLDGSNVVVLVTAGSSSSLRGIALDIAGGKMYWGDNGTPSRIQRANLDGSDVETLTMGRASYIALDVGAGKMYWTDFSGQIIQRANLDGTNVEELVQGSSSFALGSPNGIALDPNAGKMYWTDYWSSHGRILRANLEIPAGELPEARSDIEVLVPSNSANLVANEGLALDLAAGKMYWTHQPTGRILRSNLDGSGVEDLVTSMNASINSPEGIALDLLNGKMYWTDLFPAKIVRAKLDGSNVEVLLTGGLLSPYGIALAVPSAPSDEACCFTDGSCTDELPIDCEGMGGTSQGIYSICHGDNNGDGIDDACTCAIPPAGMIGWWPLDETSGTVAEEVIYGRNGTHFNGPTPLVGQLVENSLCFEGFVGQVDLQGILVPDEPALNFGTGDFSIDAWIRTYTTHRQTIVQKILYSNDAEQQVGFVFQLGQGRLSFMMADGLGDPFCSSTCPSTDGCTFWESTGPNVADGAWHHVAVTADRDSTTGLVFYVDGVDVGTFDPTCQQGSITNTQISLVFAGNQSDLCMDEIEIFDRALTESQVQAIYFAGPLGKCEGCYDGTGPGMVRKLFCIEGIANGMPFAWRLTGPSFSLEELNAPATPAGADAENLATVFVGSLNSVGCPAKAEIQEQRPNCFTVGILGDDSFELEVGPPGDPGACCITCTATVNGCSYNPTITETEECTSSICPALAPHDIRKIRYLSVDPRGAGGVNAGQNFDIKLTLISTLVNGVTAVGSEWWANAPDADCLAIVGPTQPALPLNWDTCPTLHLTGCPIIPTSTYDIVAVVGGSETGPPLIGETQVKPGDQWHGDCVGVFTGTEWTGPNGVTSIDDAVAAIKTFQNPSNTPGCPAPPCNATHVSVTDMEPNLAPGPQINKVVNIADVFSIIKGFQGFEYPGFDLTQCP